MSEDPLDKLTTIRNNIPDTAVSADTKFTWENVIFQKGVMSKGSEFRDMKRDGLHEYFHVIRGRISFKLQDFTRTLMEGGHIHILPHESYWVYAFRDTQYIYIAFPPNGGDDVEQ